MRINHNIAALNTHRQLNAASTQQSKSMEKLASGLRINKAGDDAAGLAISEKMRAQVRGLDQASKNAQDGISMIQTAEGALNETHSILQRMRELATQSGNDTNVSIDRGEIQKEINALTSEINRIGNTTEFNTQKVLKGHAGNTGATEAVKTAVENAVEGTNFTDASFASAALVLNGQAVSLDNLKALDGEAATIDNIVTALQNDINAAFDGIAHNTQQFTVSKSDGGTGNKIVIETVNTGATAKVDLTGTTAAVTNALGFTDTSAVKGKNAEFTAQFQIGANENQSMTIQINDMRAAALGLVGDAEQFTGASDVTDGTNSMGVERALDVSNHANAANAITAIDQAIENVSGERSKLGAYQNRLEHTINNLGTSSENLTAAESRIRDVDMAKEMMEQTKNSILSQAAQAMLAQANQQPQGVLQLLR